MSASKYLQLLSECGVTTDQEAFEALFPWQPIPELEPSRLPDEPIGYTEDDVPIFTSEQVDMCDPEVFGFDTYQVFETAYSAHPQVKDPSLWNHMQRTRKHVYDRTYIFRWTLYNTLGIAGPAIPDTFLDALKKALGGQEALRDPNIYVRVREILRINKLRKLYLAIPRMITLMGGPVWTVPPSMVLYNINDAFRCVHHTFEKDKASFQRKRFPKMMFVVMALLEQFGIQPPYTIPFALTDVHLDNLRVIWNKINTSRKQ